ncbi:ribosomal protein S20 [Bacillus fengqiuensis]|nr:ribosomal protein S20 [Bacillus fengqiuensis]
MTYDARDNNPHLKNQEESDNFTRAQFSKAYAELDEMLEKGLIDQNEYDSTKIDLKDL